LTAATLVVVATLAGCGDDLGPARPRPLPTPDDRPALLTPGARSPRIASYRIEARLDAAEKRITATERLTWTNTGSSPVDSLPFHLYMNAFKNEESVFMKESLGRHRGIEATSHWGWIEVSSIKVGGEELRGGARFGGPDETVLDVPLPRPVGAGETVEVELAFETQLPEVFARTGFKGDFLMIGQWFPKIGVRVGPPGAERWHCAPFHLFSEFFADFGTYDVTLTVPSTHVVAATGVLTAATDNGDGTHTLVYRAEDVHDFVWMADPYMQVTKGTAKVAGGEVEVRVYHRPAQRDFARRHLAAGIGAIETFSELFVPYPWPVMSIVDPPVGADGAAGMEYPTLVTTAGDGWYARPGVRLPEYVTIHEVGHNWFQGILASNEVDEAWMDEGVNDWADAEVIARLYGERGGIVDWMGITLEIHRLRRAVSSPIASLPTPIATASWAFVDGADYAEATYGKTAFALETLENLVGRDAFLAAMKGYAEAWAWKHPTGRDFFAAISGALGQDLAWFWGPVFHGTGAADFAVRTAECRPRREPRGVFGSGDERRVVDDTPDTGTFHCEVVVVNDGAVSVPVDVEMRFADGTRVRERWDDRGHGRWHRFEFDRSSKLTAVEIDPDRRVMLADDPLDDHLRLQPDARASWRAAARVSFWAQTAMQVFGL
jgi:hypothetical protein